jgi:hypothetical protein
MDDGTDGWMQKASRKMTTMSFTICNNESKHNILLALVVGKANKENKVLYLLILLAKYRPTTTYAT